MQVLHKLLAINPYLKWVLVVLMQVLYNVIGHYSHFIVDLEF